MGISCLDTKITVDVSMLRTAEEARRRLPRATPLNRRAALALRQPALIPQPCYTHPLPRKMRFAYRSRTDTISPKVRCK